MLERKGALVALVTTAGFEDTISIGRQARAKLYDWFAEPLPCIVPSGLRFGIAEKTSADGTVLRRPEQANVAVSLEGARPLVPSQLPSASCLRSQILRTNSRSRMFCVSWGCRFLSPMSESD